MNTVFKKFSRVALLSSYVALGLALMPVSAQAKLSPELTAKVERYKAKLTEWARNPVLVGAVREANKANGLMGMSNAKWEGLAETDAIVTSFQTNPAGRALSEMEADQGISKLYLRDAKGNLVAGSNKPLLYNNGTRKPFSEAFKGTPFVEKEVKPDTTTQIKGVQLSVPVLDGGNPIGVLQTSVVAE